MPSRQIPVNIKPVTCVCRGNVILDVVVWKVNTTRRLKPNRETPMYPIEKVSREVLDGLFKIVPFEDRNEVSGRPSLKSLYGVYSFSLFLHYKQCRDSFFHIHVRRRSLRKRGTESSEWKTLYLHLLLWIIELSVYHLTKRLQSSCTSSKTSVKSINTSLLLILYLMSVAEGVRSHKKV